MSTEGTERGSLVSWQWSLYPRGHRDRGNLILHVITVPWFMTGTVMLASAFARPLLAPVGAGLMALAVVLQGRGHKREGEKPVAFNGPLDVVARLFVEQWVTFPRYVLSGGFARAWKGPAEGG